MTLYRALLRLYPASFRADYAAELTRTFEENVRDRGRAGALVAALGDVVPNAFAAHWELLVQDLKYTARTLSHSRGFALATILVTALGVGANTATFSVADFVLVRPLPFPEPDKIVRLCEGPRDGSGWGCMNQLSPLNWRDARDMNRSFTGLGAFTFASANLVGSGEPIRVGGMRATPEVMSVLGVRPMLGRTFDSTAADLRTIVISYGLWQSYFAGDSGVIGSTLGINEVPHTVIGVMPASFSFPDAGAQVWLPMEWDAQAFSRRDNNYIDAVARLRPGVTFEQARGDLTRIFDKLAKDYPETNSEVGFSFFRQQDYVFPRQRLTLLALCGASLCMLLLTCANLASLMLVRSAARERELAVRAALGAGRDRLVRQMLTESVTLAVIGGLAGAVVAAFSMPLLALLVPTSLPVAAQPTMDARVFAFAMGFTALIGLGFGLMPALRVGGVTGFSALREGARGSARRTWVRSTLVGIEVAMSVVLLASSGLLIRAMWRVEAVETGFNTDNVLTMRTTLPTPRYDDKGRRAAFYATVTERVRALPGVEGAAYATALPLTLGGGITQIVLPGEVLQRRDDRQNASMRLTTPGYFDVMRIPLRQGRDFRDTDTPDRQLVAIVSASLAQRHWPGQDPIGRTFTSREEVRTVVGVVGDVMVRGLERESEPQLYLPYQQPPDQLGELYQPKDLVVRTARQDPTIAAAIRAIIRQVDPIQPITGVRMAAEVVAGQTATRRAQLNVLVALAALALVLTAVGIHGLLAFSVAQRDREIGVRLALGADPNGVARMVMSEGLVVAALGIIPGLFAAFLAARAMSALLFGVEPGDPKTLAAVAAVCLVTTLVACARPALRAAGIHPMSALRAD